MNICVWITHVISKIKCILSLLQFRLIFYCFLGYGLFPKTCVVLKLFCRVWHLNCKCVKLVICASCYCFAALYFLSYACCLTKALLTYCCVLIVVYYVVISSCSATNILTSYITLSKYALLICYKVHLRATTHFKELLNIEIVCPIVLCCIKFYLNIFVFLLGCSVGYFLRTCFIFNAIVYKNTLLAILF